MRYEKALGANKETNIAVQSISCFTENRELLFIRKARDAMPFFIATEKKYSTAVDSKRNGIELGQAKKKFTGKCCAKHKEMPNRNTTHFNSIVASYPKKEFCVRQMLHARW